MTESQLTTKSQALSEAEGIAHYFLHHAASGNSHHALRDIRGALDVWIAV